MGEVFWVGFEGQSYILVELKSIFNQFSKKFPDAAGHLKTVTSEKYNGKNSGYISDNGIQVGLVTYIEKKGDTGTYQPRQTFVHELGHLLHMYFENSNFYNIIYKFTKKHRPRNRSEFSDSYALKNRFEAFACGFVEWWFESGEKWSKWTKKIDKIIGILNSKINIKLNKIWSWIEDRLDYTGSASISYTDYDFTGTFATTASDTYIMIPGLQYTSTSSFI
jgi:hypothetical protein